MAREAQRKGFTIIEVALVLAISGLILIGIISTTSGAVARQRYNDSVQSIAEQLRVYYTQVNNPQAPEGSNGKSTSALYGKYIVFKNQDGASVIQSQNITGKAEFLDYGSSSAFSTTTDLSNAGLKLQGNTDEYRAPWGATIEKANSNPDSHDLYTGALLILYSPNGGAIHTYLGDDFKSAVNNITTGVVNLCVNSPDLNAAGSIRRNIRIAADGRNSSAVELIDVDSEDNQCR